MYHCVKKEKCIHAASQERHRRNWEHSLGVDWKAGWEGGFLLCALENLVLRLHSQKLKLKI